jgi:DNA polymerase III epsilon subunit-like protein
MAYFIVDTETDGAFAPDYSMISFACVKVDEELKTTFKATLRPISDKYDPEALQVSGFSREETLEFEDPEVVMKDFVKWLGKETKGSSAIFLSDNNGFDWSFMNYYLHKFAGKNPFGWSSRRIGDIYCGAVKDLSKNNVWKMLRVTKHSHDPLDDAMGNAEAFLSFTKDLEIKVKL